MAGRLNHTIVSAKDPQKLSGGVCFDDPDAPALEIITRPCGSGS
jgi:hypothetical protein